MPPKKKGSAPPTPTPGALGRPTPTPTPTPGASRRQSSKKPHMAGPAPQIQVPVEQAPPIHATPEQIQSAIEVARTLPYGPNINPNDDVTAANNFASCIEVMSSRFIPQNPKENLEAKTTVTFIAGEHSGIIGIFLGVQDPTQSRAFPIIDVEIPDVSPFITNFPPITPELQIKLKLKYILGTLLNKALLGEDILVQLQQILETLDGSGTEEICVLLNEAFERLQCVKGKEVSEYIKYCEEKLKQKLGIWGREACSNDSAFSDDFMTDVREFSKVFRIGAEYSPDFNGVPLKIIVFTDGPSDKYKINWSLVPQDIFDDPVKKEAFETFVSNTAFNFVFNVKVIIPGHGTFVINLSLNKKKFHPLFGRKCYMLLHDLISFLLMYISSDIFKGIIIGEILKLDKHVNRDDNIEALINMSLIIFDMGCAVCREDIDVTVTPPKYSRLVFDFFTRENMESRDDRFKTFRLLPDLSDINEVMLPTGINRDTLSISQIAVHVPNGFSSAVVVRPFGYNILDTGTGNLGDDSMKQEPSFSQRSDNSQLDDAPPGKYEKLNAKDIKAIIDQMNVDIESKNGKNVCLTPISQGAVKRQRQQISDSDSDYDRLIEAKQEAAAKNEDIDKFLRQSQQMLNDVDQLRQPQSEDKSQPPSQGILSVFSGLASLVLGLGTSLRSRLGFGGGGGRGVIHRNITKTRNRRRKNKTKKLSRKHNKRHRKTHRLHKNHKHKIHKSHKK